MREPFDIEDISSNDLIKIKIEHRKMQFARYMIQKKFKNSDEFNRMFNRANRMFRISMKKTELYNIAMTMKKTSNVNTEYIMKFCVSHSSRSHSGVCVIATIMAPAYKFLVDGVQTNMNFTCKYDCAFCPDDPEQARSYPRSEPVPMRGEQNEFCVVRQAHSRMHTLNTLHHAVDKIEWLILGGTWSSFPKEYRQFYHTSILFAANLWHEGINVCKIQGDLGAISNDRYVVETTITTPTPITKSKSKSKSIFTRFMDEWHAFASAMLGIDNNTNSPPSNSLSNSLSNSPPNPDAWRDHVRPMGTFEEEAAINRKSTCRVIGITAETRPDEINLKELRFMRSLGVTRIQMGFQHTDNEVLKKNKRGCSIERCIKGLKLAMINGFKVDGHWMPDLPGSNIEMDYAMIKRAFTDPDLRCDQVKIYPCQVLDFTLIKKWYDSGEYVPYGEHHIDWLMDLIIYAKSIMPPWVRTNRVVRDFPHKIIRGGLKSTHIYDLVLKRLKEGNIKCVCIRCREVKRRNVNHDNAILHVREYNGCGGTEYFISMEVGDDPGILLGFCRLRINPRDMNLSQQFDELHGAALIRELHVYGNTTVSADNVIFSQHRGYGKRLLIEAERIAKSNGCDRIAVISGIGVQDYYNRRGYEDGFYMIKSL